MERNRRTGLLGRVMRPWAVGVLVVVSAAVALGIGATPRYIEELCIGGGYGDSADGGADFEQDGDILADGDIVVGGSLGVAGGVTGPEDGSLTMTADGSVVLQTDTDDDGAETFQFKNGTGTEVARIDESGDMQIDGDATISGHNIKDSSGLAAITFDGSQNTTVNGHLTIGGWAKEIRTADASLKLVANRNAGDSAIVDLNPRPADGTSSALVRMFRSTDTTGSCQLQILGHNTSSVKGYWQDDGTILTENHIYVDSDDGGVYFGEDQDFCVRYQLDSGHYWKLKDGSGNDLLTVKDAGTTGDVGATGALTIAGLATFNGGMSLQNTDTFQHGVYVVSHVVNYDDSSPVALCTVADGYVVVDVYAEVTTAWDQNETVTVGDGSDPDGFATDAELDTENTGWKNTNITDRGAYLQWVDDSDATPLRKIYTASDTIDAFLTDDEDPEAGQMTVYIVIQRLK